MEENKNYTTAPEMQEQEAEESKSSIDFATIYTTLILNWKWFLVSLIICLGTAVIYLRYVTPVYKAGTKMLIKNDDTPKNSKYGAFNTNTLGLMTNSEGIDNEIEILQSRTLAEMTVRDLKLYATYFVKGRVKKQELYKTQPVSVDLDPSHLESLKAPINLTIKREGSSYHVTGTYYVNSGVNSIEGPFSLDKVLTKLPATINTRAGIIYLVANGVSPMEDGESLLVNLVSPKMASYKYAGALTVAQSSKTTTIVNISISDAIPDRAVDYLRDLAVSYNRQANADKNEIATNTEAFINSRLEKINAELGNTEGQLENYKRSNNVVSLEMSAGQAVNNADQYEQKLAEANTQIDLLKSLQEYMNEPANKYQTLPSNVGLTDQSATALINKYNDIVLERNRLLRSASENSPTVTPLTSQLDDLSNSIRRAMTQARRSMEIQRGSVASQQGKYQSQIQESPEQERILSQIGRQQEVKSGLYLMLLQKREENSISLAATANKGKLLDEPEYMGKISPKSSLILLIALILALAIPAIVLVVLQFFHYKIEGRDDVVNLTKLPIIADIAVANEEAKTKAGIIVHENKNSIMEEIFRSMRTNLQYMLKANQKVILFTSSISGEGKTFVDSNLAVSFALLEKKVILVGLDIRKPRLAELFEIDDRKHGITNLLVKDNPTAEDVRGQILPSGINNNLDLLMAGPIPPNPTELLQRESLDQIFKELRNEYDYIIIDTAPVGLVTDTLPIGRVADVTVVICRADYTPKENFGYINEIADTDKLPNVCIALNGIDLSKKKYGYYYGYGKYGRYGRYGRYGHYSHNGRYGHYGRYGTYSTYGSRGTYGKYGQYSNSHYGDKNDNSVKR